MDSNTTERYQGHDGIIYKNLPHSLPLLPCIWTVFQKFINLHCHFPINFQIFFCFLISSRTIFKWLPKWFNQLSGHNCYLVLTGIAPLPAATADMEDTMVEEPPILTRRSRRPPMESREGLLISTNASGAVPTTLSLTILAPALT